MPITYNIYSNDGLGGPIDYDTPIGTTSGLTFTTAALAHPDDWRFAVRASDGTFEEQNVDAAVRLTLDAAGADVTNLPAAPVGLSAWPIADGAIRVSWGYPTRITAGVTGFHVYIGSPTPDYGTAAATASSAAVAGGFQVDLAGLTDGTTYQVGVRAYNAAGEEANTTVVSATAIATGPDAVVGLTISTDPGDW